MIEGRKVIAVVTARAGSKGLPGKNYKVLHGRPLVHWSILAGLKSEYVDHVLVSGNCPDVKRVTESLVDEIKRDGGNYGKTMYIERPAELATASSKNEEALVHAAQAYESEFKPLASTDIIVNLQPTSPIRRRSLIDDMLVDMLATKSKSALTVSKHTPFFIQPTQSGLKWHFDRLNRPMRQQLLESDFYYHDDGCVYICELDVLSSEMCRVDDNPLLYINDPYASLQIDTIEDFILIDKVSEIIGDIV